MATDKFYTFEMVNAATKERMLVAKIITDPKADSIERFARADARAAEKAGTGFVIDGGTLKEHASVHAIEAYAAEHRKAKGKSPEAAPGEMLANSERIFGKVQSAAGVAEPPPDEDEEE